MKTKDKTYERAVIEAIRFIFSGIGSDDQALIVFENLCEQADEHPYDNYSDPEEDVLVWE